jgi:hypothetical protein
MIRYFHVSFEFLDKRGIKHLRVDGLGNYVKGIALKVSEGFTESWGLGNNSRNERATLQQLASEGKLNQFEVKGNEFRRNDSTPPKPKKCQLDFFNR